MGGGLHSRPILRYVVTAEAVKTISCGSTRTHKRLQLISAQTCCSTWYESNLWAVLLLWAHTEVIKPPCGAASPHLMFPGNPGWPAMTDGHWDSGETCVADASPPTDRARWQQWATSKAEGRWRRRRRGRERAIRMMGGWYSARQPGLWFTQGSQPRTSERKAVHARPCQRRRLW